MRLENLSKIVSLIENGGAVFLQPIIILYVFYCLHLSTIRIADFILSTEGISSSESTKMQCWHNSHFAERHRDRFQQALPSWLSDQCTGSLCNLGRTLERADLSLRSSRS